MFDKLEDLLIRLEEVLIQIAHTTVSMECIQ